MENLSIQLNDIGYVNYPPIFKCLDLNFKSKGFYKIIGDNGTGKSTLFKALNGELDWIHSNKIHINLNGSKINPFKNKEIVFIKDQFEGYLYLKPIEYIIYISKLYQIDIKWDCVEFLFKELDFKQYSHYLIKNLSQGNKQKLTFICSVLLNRPLILFDEAFEHIDSKTIKYIKKNISVFLKDTFVLFTSHTQLMDDIADNIIDLKDVSN